jgi:hypothetical protein
MERIKKGELVVFKGPLMDQDGKERVAAGKCLEGTELGSVNWLVEGVEGSIHAM